MGAGTWYCIVSFGPRWLATREARRGGGTDSIHLAAQRVDDDAHGLVARGRVERVAGVELERHGDLAFVAGEGVVVEGDVGGFHGGGWGVGFVVVLVVLLAVGLLLVVGFAVGSLFKHD